MNRSNSIRTVLLCALISASSTFGVVQAAAPAPAPSVSVSYRDLDLSRPEDVGVLYHRLQQAAASVCPSVPKWELTRYPTYQRCVTAALDEAVLQVRSPELLALHRAGSDGHQRG
jgi:UrcA family protein